jgi:DNA modification methylase
MDELSGVQPYFSTDMGHAYLGDSLELLPKLPPASVDMICTSPPFALLRKKAYGNVHADEYVDWFKRFAREFARVLKPTGSLVIDIGGTWVKGHPIRSLYHYELLLQLCKPIDEGGCGFYLAQELYWYNPAKLPTPAEWVTVRRERVKDAVNTVWWLSLSEHPKANNKRVLKPYSDSQIKLMQNGYKPRLRPSEHDISDQFGKNNNGAIPPNIVDGLEVEGEEIGEPVLVPTNVISASNTSSNDQYLRLCRQHDIKPHPARFPRPLPEFVIGLCTEEKDVVLDPFAGSNMTGYVAENMGRHWIALEQNEEYLKGASFRFVKAQAEEPASDDIEEATEEIISGMRQIGQKEITAETLQSFSKRGKKISTNSLQVVQEVLEGLG